MNASASTGKNNAGTSGANTILNQALAWAPTTDPYNEDGTYVANDPTGSLKSNPLALLYDAEQISEKTFLTALAGANYVILPGFSVDFQAAVDKLFDKEKSYTGPEAAGSSPSSAGVTDSKGTTVQTTTQLSYNRDFGKHTINAVAAFETQTYHYASTTATATGLTFPDLKYDNLKQASTYETESGYSMWTLVSYLARLNYSYDGRYLASVSVRHDGSSKFSEGNKFSTFPAAALAWNIANESFMQDVPVLSALKLRASWGLTGSQAIEPYATKSAFGSASYTFAMGGTTTSGIALSDPANSNLKWETTEQWNFGIDLGLFKNRLLLEADYYTKTTRDLLLNKGVTAYQGGGSIVSNIGSIRNSGFDFTLTGRIVETKDFSLESTVNFSILKNRVRDLGEDDTVYVATNLTGINDGAYDFIYRVGEPLGTIYGLKYLGPWQKEDAALAAEYGCVPGDARYEDRDNSKTYDSSDYQIIGYGMPKYTLGWNTNFRWKNLSVNMFFQGVFGADKLNYNRCIFMSASRDVRGATFSEVKDRYIPGVNEDAYLPAWSPTSTWYPVSSLWLENGSYLRLKNLSIAYDFSVRKIGDFTVSLNATNLFTITNYKGIDPEASNVGGGTSDVQQGLDYGAYPNSKSYTLGLSIRF